MGRTKRKEVLPHKSSLDHVLTSKLLHQRLCHPSTLFDFHASNKSPSDQFSNLRRMSLSDFRNKKIRSSCHGIVTQHLLNGTDEGRLTISARADHIKENLLTRITSQCIPDD